MKSQQTSEHPVTVCLNNLTHASIDRCHEYVCAMRLDGTHGLMLEIGAVAAALGQSIKLIGQVPNDLHFEVLESWIVSPGGHCSHHTMTDERKCGNTTTKHDNSLCVLYQHNHFQALRESHAPILSAVRSLSHPVRMNRHDPAQLETTSTQNPMTSGVDTRQHWIKRGRTVSDIPIPQL